MTTVTVFDATHSNIGHLPKGQAAGYTTGSADIRWTGADSAAHPGWVRIDQDAAASDPAADVLDVERGAASPSDCPGWAKRALADFKAVRRPGQRKPAIYCSRSSVTQVVTALIAGRVPSGVGLWIADWDNDQHAATVEVEAAAGPFPVIGRQFRNAGLYDVSVFSSQWLKEVSVTDTPPAKPPVPPGPWNDAKVWDWQQVVVAGQGLDGKFHLWSLEHDTWVKVL